MSSFAPTRAPNRLDAWLGGAPWAYETSRVQAVGFDFSVRVMDEELGRFLDEAWAPMHVPGAPVHRYSLVDRGPRRPRRFRLFFDTEPILRSSRPSQALSILFWHVNRQVVANRGRHLLLHAAAAEHNGRAVIIPAAMESGKTTLVAGLTRSGLRYLTDEAVAVDLQSLTVCPYPKPLSVDQGSWEVLASLRPRFAEHADPYLALQWQVPARSIRPDAVGGPCPPAWIVTTSYQPDQPTTLVPMPPSEAAIALATNTFEFDADPARHLEAIAELVRRCRRYRLVASDLDQACQLVLALLNEEI